MHQTGVYRVFWGWELYDVHHPQNWGCQPGNRAWFGDGCFKTMSGANPLHCRWDQVRIEAPGEIRVSQGKGFIVKKTDCDDNRMDIIDAGSCFTDMYFNDYERG